MPTWVFMIQASTPRSEHWAMPSRGPKALLLWERFQNSVLFFVFFSRSIFLIPGGTSHPAILLTSPAQSSLPHSALANPSESAVSAGERRPTKTPNHISGPVLQPLFLTGGTCPCTSSLIHEGGGRRGRGVIHTSSSLSFAQPLIYSEKHDCAATQLWQRGPGRGGGAVWGASKQRWRLS